MTRSEEFAGPQARGPELSPLERAALHAVPGALGELLALKDECQRLHLLIGELLVKNHELRSDVARLRTAQHLRVVSGQAEHTVVVT